MKKIIVLLVLTVLFLTGCQAATGSGEVSKTDEPITVRVGVPNAPPALPVLHMQQTNALGDNVSIEIDKWDTPEQLIAMVQDGNHDLFAFPLTVASKLYNKGIEIKLTNVNTWGVTYFLTTDSTLLQWADLKGKTIYIPLQSSPPDILTQYFLESAGLKIGEDVQIVYSTTTEIAQMLQAGTIEYATLIEPQVTAAMQNNSNIRVAFSFEEEWQKLKGGDSLIPNAGFGGLTSYIDENIELVKDFEEAYENSLNWVNDNPEEAAKMAEEQLGLKAVVLTKAIPNMGLVYKNSFEARDDLQGFYELLYQFDPTSMGGAIPDQGLYFEE